MKYVYILQSINSPEKFYIGSTNDLKRRINEHNHGKATHSDKYAPWKLKTYLAFGDDQRAIEFEDYLKSASGRAFAIKRL